MKTIAVEVNDITAVNFNDFSPEMKNKISSEVADMITQMNYDARIMRLQKLVAEINAGDNGMTMDPEILFELLSAEEE